MKKHDAHVLEYRKVQFTIFSYFFAFLAFSMFFIVYSFMAISDFLSLFP